MAIRLNFTGRKILGGSLAPNPNDSGTPLVSAIDMRQMWQVWDWNSWIKPQIDYLLGDCGCNTVRLLGCVWDVASGVIATDEYVAKSIQIAEYCASKGAYYYPNGSSISGAINYSLTADQVADVFCRFLLPLQKIGNSIGVDLFQEANVGYFTTQFLIDLNAALKARGMILPVTCSTSSNSITPTGGETWVNANSAALDYFDFHIYNFTLGWDYLDYFLLNSEKDVLVGEVGKNTTSSAATGGGTADVQTADFMSVYRLAMSGHPRIRGALMWSVADQRSAIQWPTQSDLDKWQYGIFDTNASAMQFTARRHKVDLLRRYTRGSCALSKEI